MKLSHTVSSLIFSAILLALMSTETIQEVSTRKYTADMRRILSNRTRRSTENTEAVNAVSKEPTLNESKLIDNSTDVGIEGENKLVDGLEEVEVEFENENGVSKNATESRNDDIASSNDNSTLDKSETEVRNDNSNIAKRDVKTEVEEKKANAIISDNVVANGANRMLDLRNKFLLRSSSRNEENGNSSSVSTVVIGPNHVNDFKRNFQNSYKYRDTLFEPVLTTVIKTKTILKDDRLVTVTEKNFLFYRDQTELPTASRVYNTTTNTNSQQFQSAANEQKTTRLTPDPYLPSAPIASKRSDVESLYESCAEVMKQNVEVTNGVYAINIFSHGPTDVYCFADPVGAGCAWTAFMRRVKIGDTFNKNWKDYKYGFGEPDESFFLGLERIYALTSDGKQELGIFTKFETNDIEVEKYAYFVVGDAERRYRVEELGAFSRTSAVCRLTRFSKFSTQDVDSGYKHDTCAQALGMGWWYSERCKSAIKFSGVRAYLNAPTIMGLRPRNCKA